MAKAIFHKHQRVFVRPVGTWALVEHVKPQWVKDVEEPVRVFYDCGLGRDFSADELSAEHSEIVETGHWRLLRAKNKWQSDEECARHPHPGTFPVIVTDSMDWGGWRVPAAEYDRDPSKLEAQARLIVHAPQLLSIAEDMARLTEEETDLPAEWAELVKKTREVIRNISATPEPNPRTDNARAA